MPADRVLLIEDDPQMAELMTLLLNTASPGIRIDWVTSVDQAEASFSADLHRLVICDWNLPGKPGIALVHALRARRERVPILMCSGRHDRASVIAAAKEGVNGFIAKPFKVEHVVERLLQYLGDGLYAEAAPLGEGGEAAEAEMLAYLRQRSDADLELPMLADVRDLVRACNAEEPPDLRQLAAQWQQDPTLSARLLAMANSSVHNPQGVRIATILEALQRLGWRTSLNVATALSLRKATAVHDVRLSLLIEQQLDLCEKVSEQVGNWAQRAGLEAAPGQTAALLHRLGELCVLYLLDAWQHQHGRTLDTASFDQALQTFARPFADRLKAHWRYPISLRELIGAIYGLPPGAAQRERFAQRLAGAAVYQDLDEVEQSKLERLLLA